MKLSAGKKTKGIIKRKRKRKKSIAENLAWHKQKQDLEIYCSTTGLLKLQLIFACFINGLHINNNFTFMKDFFYKLQT